MPSTLKFRGPKLSTLSFDIENRPLSYLGMDFTTSDITAIACRFTHETNTYCWLLGRHEQIDILRAFVSFYDKADIVTGHYIRNHDLPIINGALIELGLDPLKPKLTSDTKNDLIGFKGISKSQENLAEMLGVPAPKIQMNQIKWRAANRLTQPGIDLTRQRVVGDIEQHIALRNCLIEKGLLNPPKLWRGRG